MKLFKIKIIEIIVQEKNIKEFYKIFPPTPKPHSPLSRISTL
jgi:hypothetical protein